MSLQIQLKKSAVTQKQPFASDLAVGELALNYNADGPFLTCKDTAGNVRKLNHVWVSATAPTGPSAGDLWLDTSATTAVLKVYKDSSATWVNATSIPLATTSVYGTVQLATSADITNGTSGKVVDAAQLQSKITAELSATPITFQQVQVVGNTSIGGDLTVNGTTTTINTQDLLVEDKNIIIGNVDTPSDVTADSGGITLKGTTDKTINWVNATAAWTSSERFSVPLGTAAAPSITLTGDPNTGIYSPGADQLALSTNGTGRLFVNADGTIDFGTTTGSSTPTVKAVANPVLNFSNGTNSAYVGLVDVQNRLINFSTSGTTLVQSNSDVTLRVVGSNSIRFDTANTERLRITSAGLVGIGTSSPIGKLAVGNTSNNFLVSIDSTASYAEIQAYNAPLYINRQGNNTILNSGGGSVGIGTTSPDSELHISKANTTTKLILERTNSATAKWSMSAGGGSLLFTDEASSKERLRITSTGQLSFIGAGSSGSPAVGFNGSAPSNSLVIDSSGRLLVGTSSSPVSGAGQYARLVVQGYTGQATRDGALSIQRGEAAANITSGENIGKISFNDSAGFPFADIAVQADGNAGTNDYPGRLVFSVTADGASSPTERMRIENTGQTRVFGTNNVILSRSAQAAGTTNHVFAGYHSATDIASEGTASSIIYTNGNVVNTNNSYGAISDIKLKENIVDASSQWNDIKALQVRNYNFKPETGAEQHTQLGLIAQEVELVSPGLVSESPDRDTEGNDLGTVTKSVNYSVLYMKAVKALQEAMERIETLEAKVAALEAS